MLEKAKRCIDTLRSDILCIFGKKLVHYYITLNYLPYLTGKIVKEVAVFRKKTINSIKKFE